MASMKSSISTVATAGEGSAEVEVVAEESADAARLHIDAKELEAQVEEVTIELREVGDRLEELQQEKLELFLRESAWTSQLKSLVQVARAVSGLLKKEPESSVSTKQPHLADCDEAWDCGYFINQLQIELLDLRALLEQEAEHWTMQQADLISTSQELAQRTQDLQMLLVKNTQLEEMLQQKEATLQSAKSTLRAVREAFRCPIRHAICGDPVIASDGHTYSRGGISPWLRHHGTSPLTREVLERRLVPNLQFKSALRSLSESGLGASDDEDDVETPVQERRLDLMNLITRRMTIAALDLLRNENLRCINDQLESGDTMLHAAIYFEMPITAQSIIAHPQFEKINARDRRGVSALHLAAQRGFLNVCQAIVERKDFEEISAVAENMTALEHAQQQGHREVVEVLQHHMQRWRSRFQEDPLKDAVPRDRDRWTDPDLFPDQTLELT